jgi:maleylacetoacetate isomerase
MITLYTYFRSSAAFRVRIALNLKGLTYQPVIVSLPKGEQMGGDYLAVNPQGLVPTLLDNSVRLSQSLAIIDYLDEVYPAVPLLPVAPAERARVRSLAQVVACDIHPINNLRILKFIKSMGHEEDEVNAWYRHWCHEGLASLERELNTDGGVAGKTGRFCHGDTVSLADVCLVPQVFNAKRYEVNLSGYPKVMAVFDACMALPAFDAAQPSKQPDAF